MNEPVPQSIFGVPDNPVASPVKLPTKDVAVSAPDEELNVRLVPDFGAKSPVAAVVNKTLQEVSEDSSATVTLVAVVAVVALVALPLNAPLNVVAVTTPAVTFVEFTFNTVATPTT